MLAAACGRGLPEPAPEGTPAPAAMPSRGCRPGEQAAVRGRRGRLTVAGEDRRYILDAPSAPADRPLPLVLVFHGFRGSAWGQRWWTGFGSLARREGFVAVHPDGHPGVRLLETTGRGWDLRPDETRDAAFVHALLDEIEEERCIDRRRVFATGMSNGGFFASLIGCVLADRLAAIAPVAGAMDLRGCAPARPVAVLLVHGSSDPVVRVASARGARDWWARKNSCGDAVERDGCQYYAGCAADVVYCEGTQGHRWPSDATARIWRFFVEHPAR